MIPQMSRQLTSKPPLFATLPALYKPTCRHASTKTPGNPYPIIGSIDLNQAPTPEDIPDVHFMRRQNNPVDGEFVNPGVGIRSFGRKHEISFWRDASAPKGQNAITHKYGLKLRVCKNHIFSYYDDEALGPYTHPLTEKVLYRYLEKKSIPLWVYAIAWATDNSTAIIRRKCEKRMRAALYHALAELGFDKHGRSLNENNQRVLRGTIILNTGGPRQMMASDFNGIVRDLGEILGKSVISLLGTNPQRQVNRRPKSR